MALMKKKKRALFDKITPVIGKILSVSTGKQGSWTNRELADRLGIPSSRLSEYKDFGYYQRRVSAPHLGAFFLFLISPATIVALADGLNAEEKDWLFDFAIESLRKDAIFLEIDIESRERDLSHVEMCLNNHGDLNDICGGASWKSWKGLDVVSLETEQGRASKALDALRKDLIGVEERIATVLCERKKHLGKGG